MQPYKKLLRLALALIGAGLLYYGWIVTTGLAVPCPFRAVTGYRCPGCGATTLCLNMLRLHPVRAFHANPFLFLTGPFLIAELGYAFIRTEKKEPLPRWNQALVICYLIALLIWGVARNVF